MPGQPAVRDPKRPNADPRRVGGHYYSAFWRKAYVVNEITDDGVLVGRWEDGLLMRHSSPWNWDKDLVISEPGAALEEVGA